MATKKDSIISYSVLDGLVIRARKVKDLDIIPDSINNPTGKVAQAMFENIDVKLYYPDPKVAFRIGPDPDKNRIMCWRKALYVFYEYLETEKGYVIKEDIIVTSKERTSLEILVRQKCETKGYRISFYVTTGTIIVQGKRFRDFSDSHFPCIKYLFEKIHAVGHHAGGEEQDEKDVGGEDKGGDYLVFEEVYEEDGAGDNEADGAVGGVDETSEAVGGDNEADEAVGELVNEFGDVKLKDVGSDKKR